MWCHFRTVNCSHTSLMASHLHYNVNKHAKKKKSDMIIQTCSVNVALVSVGGLWVLPIVGIVPGWWRLNTWSDLRFQEQFHSFAHECRVEIKKDQSELTEVILFPRRRTLIRMDFCWNKWTNYRWGSTFLRLHPI